MSYTNPVVCEIWIQSGTSVSLQDKYLACFKRRILSSWLLFTCFAFELNACSESIHTTWFFFDILVVFLLCVCVCARAYTSCTCEPILPNMEKLSNSSSTFASYILLVLCLCATRLWVSEWVFCREVLCKCDARCFITSSTPRCRLVTHDGTWCR